MSGDGRIFRTVFYFYYYTVTFVFQIVDTELWLIAWQAQEDTNLIHLIREDLVVCRLFT